MIDAVGVDIVDVERIRKALDRWGDKFVERTFSRRETEYCRKHRDEALRFAARFAAKEAFVKCMGSSRGIPWSEIELVNDRSGKPRIEVSETIQGRLEARKVRQVHVSVSHTTEYAVAFVLFETWRANPENRQRGIDFETDF